MGATLMWAWLPIGLMADCSLVETGNLALFDMAPGVTYVTENGEREGGLYPGGSNRPPDEHLQYALTAADAILPLDAGGKLDIANGRIVMISLGISNARQIFGTGAGGDPSPTFMARANRMDSGKFPRLILVNGARGGRDLRSWVLEGDPHEAWTHVMNELAAANVSSQQVQAAWIYAPYRIRDLPPEDRTFPRHAELAAEDTARMVQIAKQRFPNLRLVFMSPRERAYTEDIMASGNPEPWAYEHAFSTKWLIERQISGDPALNHDPDRGEVLAPVIVWGAYLWTDGEVPRSDGFTFSCADLANDLTHPSFSGVAKGADAILAQMKTSPIATPWFLRRSIIGEAPIVTIEANSEERIAPHIVDFTAMATDPDGTIIEYLWTFGDGGFSTFPTPQKTFYVPGIYPVRLAVTDNSGNVAHADMEVRVLADPNKPESVTTWAIH